MKITLATFLILSNILMLNSQSPFITTWKTDNPGVSCNTCITIPTYPGEIYNYSVDWNNDGTYDQTGITGSVTHNFGTAGTKTIRITGTFPRIYFNYGGDMQKIININQWGDIAWSSMMSAFYGCYNLNSNAMDIPNLSSVTDLSYMFELCSVFNADIGNWNISNVTNMEAMFAGAGSFNQPIGNWNTANVTNMNALFLEAVSFNQPIGNWNTTNVINMDAMFLEAVSFNQPIGNWNTTNVINMDGMFGLAYSFNQPIGNWNTANVTGMYSMFWDATAFNQNIGTWFLNMNTIIDQMFDYSGIDCSNYSNTLIGWANNSLTPSNLSLGALGRQYGSSAVSARNYLINNKGWTITGDSYNSSCVVTLPLSFLDFSVQKQSNNISKLSWQTVNENLISHFTIQRSSDADKWEDIGEVEANNEGSGTNSYSFTDDQPLKGINYYRLRINDQDGNFEYSQVRSVYFGSDIDDFEAFGSDKSITIVSETQSGKHYIVYNSIGKKVAESNERMIPVSGSGFYLVTNGLYTKKVFVK